jgi:hypothetical protein
VEGLVDGFDDVGGGGVVGLDGFEHGMVDEGPKLLFGGSIGGVRGDEDDFVIGRLLGDALRLEGRFAGFAFFPPDRGGNRVQ